MNYVIAIEPGDKKHAFGVAVPDLPDCYSAGDTLDEAIANAREAIELWLETVIDDGLPVPQPKPLAVLQANPEYAGWIWAVIGVDLASLSDKAERINITLPARVLRRIDQAAKQAGETRSAYLARRALAA